MDIVGILILILIVIMLVNFVGTLKEMEEVIDEIIEKHNTTVNMVNTLNKRIKDLAEEQNERKRSWSL